MRELGTALVVIFTFRSNDWNGSPVGRSSRKSVESKMTTKAVPSSRTPKAADNFDVQTQRHWPNTELHAIVKRMRMAWAQQIRSDLSALTCGARAIRVSSNALSSQASEHKLESQLNATSVVRLVGNIRDLSEVGARRTCDYPAGT